MSELASLIPGLLASARRRPEPRPGKCTSKAKVAALAKQREAAVQRRADALHLIRSAKNGIGNPELLDALGCAPETARLTLKALSQQKLIAATKTRPMIWLAVPEENDD